MCVSRVSFITCPSTCVIEQNILCPVLLQENISSRLCLSILPVSFQLNVPSHVCPSKTPFNTKDFKEPLCFQFSALQKILTICTTLIFGDSIKSCLQLAHESSDDVIQLTRTLLPCCHGNHCTFPLHASAPSHEHIIICVSSLKDWIKDLDLAPSFSFSSSLLYPFKERTSFVGDVLAWPDLSRLKAVFN